MICLSQEFINGKRWRTANAPTILVNACESQAQNLATRSVLQKILKNDYIFFRHIFQVMRILNSQILRRNNQRKPSEISQFQRVFGRSVIIGSQKTQIYQWFAGSRQEVFILRKQF